MSGVINTLVVYTLLRKLITPFDQTDAYKLGIIDAEGNALKTRRDLTSSIERNAYTKLDRLVFNLKRILSTIPGGRTLMRTYASVLWLLKEDYENMEIIDEEKFLSDLEKILMKISEETPTNNVGSGNVAGLGIGDKGEPPVNRKKREKNPVLTQILKRRKLQEAFDRPEPFKVEKNESGLFTASAKIGDETLGFLAQEDFPKSYQVMFVINGSTDLTGSGNSIKVISTVLAMLKELIRIKKPDIISFSGEKDNGKGRSSLYARMIKRFAPSLGFKYSEESLGNSTMFVLSKTKKK